MEELTITGNAQTNDDAAAQASLMQRGTIPPHVAVIMDGNGRWAKRRGQARVVGHHEGVESVRDITEACAQLGVEFLTLYTFSTENWDRPRLEVNALMKLLIHTIRRERKTLNENGIRLRAIGDLPKLPRACRRELEETIDVTHNNTRMTLTLALSYSGRWELVRAMRDLAEQVQRGELPPEAITEEAITDALSTSYLPDPDLLIRTGGEFRVSNFLLWQMAYTELYVTDEYWPAFRRKRLYEAIRDFQGRDRRYGKVG